MIVRLVTPAPVGSRSGNRVTAERWARLLRRRGHRVTVSEKWRGERCDALIALHARRSFGSIRRFREDRPGAPLIVGLAGTDLYGHLATDKPARLSLAWASRLVVLQPRGREALPSALRPKARVILQSSQAPKRSARTGKSHRGEFRVCVIGHLRSVKDPFRAALAVRRLSSSSRIRVVHAGRALTPAMAARARREMARTPRWRWLGEVPHGRAMRVLHGSRLLVITSRAEGGANVLSEALAYGVPVLSSRIDGSTGILGARYPGLFEVGDTRGLANLLDRCESDPAFLRRLQRWCRRLAPYVDPAREAAAWERLLDELCPTRLRRR